MKERPGSGGRVLDSKTPQKEHKGQQKSPKDPLKNQVKSPKDVQPDANLQKSARHADRGDQKTSMTQELFSGTARLVKRVVEGRYTHFVDADSDPEKERLHSKKKPEIESSSDGHDEPAERPKKHEYIYHELEDEFGSKKTSKATNIEGIPHNLEDSSDYSTTQVESISSSLRSTFQNIPVSKGSQQSHDPIVAHAYGAKPLLDDDELSDTEVNPFAKDVASSRTSSAMSTGHSATVSPHSPFADGSDDIFGSVPLRLKRKGAIKHKPPTKAASIDVIRHEEDDIFANAPFNIRRSASKSKSPPETGSEVFVNPAVRKDVFGDAPFNPRMKRTSPDAVSPASVNMRSPSLSPKGVIIQDTRQLITTPDEPPFGSENIDPFGSGNFAAMTFSQQEPQPQQFNQTEGQFNQYMMQEGQYNQYVGPDGQFVGQTQYQNEPECTTANSEYNQFATSPEQTQHWQFQYQQQQQSYFQPQQNEPQIFENTNPQSAFPGKQAGDYSNVRQNQQFSPVEFRTMASPGKPTTGQDLFGASETFQNVYAPEITKSKCQQELLVSPHEAHAQAYTASGGGTKKTPMKPRKSANQRLHRRNSSDSRSSGSEGKPSPRTNKYYSKASDLINDENIEMVPGETNYSSLKKKKTKKQQKESSAFSNPAFSNQSYIDAEKELEIDYPEDHLSQSFTTEALRTSNADNCSDEGFHTVPRASSRKKKALCSVPADDNFTTVGYTGLH